MVVCSSLPTSLHSLVLQLLPSRNPDPADRIRAWNEWLLLGGSDPVLKFIRWSNGTTTDDEEILQDTLILGYLKVERGEYQDRNLPFSAFLKKIAWYKIMEASRKHAGQVPLDDFYEVLAEDSSDHETAELWKEHEALRRELDRLPPRRARVMLLYENGYSTAEIAAQLGIKEELVRKEKSLGLRQLRDAMVHVALAS
ncbi:MAG: sigma-70 family RNA polymerase sigma factor [Anaerolinea sp.]|nr:sigma-70 family RNA polymerase sigma factor [Anaerolinea sp.]